MSQSDINKYADCYEITIIYYQTFSKVNDIKSVFSHLFICLFILSLHIIYVILS